MAGFTYDLNGNRTSVTTPAGTVAATYDEQDRILSFGARTYTHTAHGEVASWTESGATTTLSYDVLGNLLAVGLPTGTLVQYEVDGRNRRLRRLVNGVATHGFLYQGQLRPVAELDGAGNLVSRFVYGARAVAPEYLIRGGVSYRLVADHLGSVRLVVNTTSGAIIQRLDYDAYGKVTLDTNPGFQPFGYAGGLYDPLTSLVRFGARDYDATIGRWLVKDPIRFDGGDSNLYAYVASDPINSIDPTGYAAPVIGAGVGFIVGAIGGGAGAIAQGAPIENVAAAAILGGVGGLATGASITSRLFLVAAAGLTDLITQLVLSIGCPDAVINVGSVVGSMAAATISAGFGSRVGVFEGFASQPAFIQELTKAAMGVPTTILPIVAGTLDPAARSQRR